MNSDDVDIDDPSWLWQSPEGEFVIHPAEIGGAALSTDL